MNDNFTVFCQVCKEWNQWYILTMHYHCATCNTLLGFQNYDETDPQWEKPHTWLDEKRVLVPITWEK